MMKAALQKKHTLLLAGLLLVLFMWTPMPSIAAEVRNADVSLLWKQVQDTELSIENNGQLMVWTPPQNAYTKEFRVSVHIDYYHNYAPRELRVTLPWVIRTGNAYPLVSNLPDTFAFAIEHDPNSKTTTIYNKDALTSDGSASASMDVTYPSVLAKASTGELYELKATVQDGGLEYPSKTIALKTINDIAFSSVAGSGKSIGSTRDEALYPVVFRSWPASWGEEPKADGGPFFYAYWNIYANTTGNDIGFHFDITEKPINGEVVAYRTSTVFEYTAGWPSVPTLIDGTDAYNKLVQGVAGNEQQAWGGAVVVRYPNTMLELVDGVPTATIVNEAEISLFRSDSVLKETKKLKASHTFSFTEKELPLDGIYTPSKALTTQDPYLNFFHGAASVLKAGKPIGEGIDFWMQVTAKQIIGWEATKEGAEYGVHAYTVELVDDSMALTAGGETLPLGDGDYEMRVVRAVASDIMPISYPYSPVQGGTKTQSHNSKDYPIRLYYKTSLNADWQLAGADMITSTYFNEYTLPEKTVALKMAVETNTLGIVPSMHIRSLVINSTPAVRDFVTKHDGEVIRLNNTADIRAYREGAVPAFNITKEAKLSHQLGWIETKTQFSKQRGSTEYISSMDMYRIPYSLTSALYSLSPTAIGGSNGNLSGKYPQETYEALYEAGEIGHHSAGRFHDLLPVAFTLNEDSIRLEVNGTQVTDFTVTRTPSDIALRDLVTVAWQAEGLPYMASSQAKLTFDAYAESTHQADHGRDVTNDSAYVFLDENIENYIFSTPYVPKEPVLSAIGAAQEDMQYSTNYVTVPRPADIAESRADLRVKTSEEFAFVKDTAVLQSGEYRYQLRRVFGGNEQFAGNIFLMNIEQATPTNGWLGTLTGIDLTKLAGKELAPVVYVATTYQPENVQPNFASPAWTQYQPGDDFPAVKAVAFDLRKTAAGEDFYADPQSSLVVELVMQAPDNVLPYFQKAEDPVANSRAVFFWQDGAAATASGVSTPTTVHLRPLALTVEKSSDVPSGTLEAPADVAIGSGIVYTIALQNEGEFEQTIGQIEWTDTLPEALAVDAQVPVQFAFGEEPFAPLPDAQARITMNQTGNTLSLAVDELSMGERVQVRIPAIVLKGEATAENLIANTAVVTSVLGEPYVVESNTTYHQRLPFVYETIDFTIQAKKELEGKALTENAYTFELLDCVENVINTATNAADGSITFGARSVNQPGVYLYSVREAAGTESNVTYDKAVWTVRVTVDDVEDKLVPSLSYEKDGVTAQQAIFTNIYTAPVVTASPTVTPAAATPAPTSDPAYESTSFTIKAQKVLHGKALAANEFTFQLLDKPGNVIDTVGNAADGSITFAARTTRRPGIYMYTMREVNDNKTSIVYDNTLWSVRANVQDAGGGVLKTSITYLKNGTPMESATFYNDYKLPPTGDSTPHTILALTVLAVGMLSISAIWRRRRSE